MGIWLGPRGSGGITENDFTYSGNYIFTQSGKNWEMALLDGNAASLVFSKNPGKVDIFAVAGGSKASYYGTTPQNAQVGPSHGAPGGRGGECVTRRAVKLAANTNYSVSIGGSDQSTTISGGDLSITAASGLGSLGGVGGVAAQDTTTNATAGADGVFAYGEESDTLITTEFQGHRFGSGGGAGGAMLFIDQNKNALNSLGGESNGPNDDYGKGGSYGSRNGSAGYPNHGQGGGGPYFWFTGSANRYGDGTDNALGLGGSGIVFIRNAQ